MPNEDLLQIDGPEQSMLDANLPDGGLPPAVGVQSFQVFRASRDLKPDGVGFTYHHHVDMACWRGRLYVAWNSCERDEDVWPSRELFSTSVDGAIWSPPSELFPQGLSTALRMYFFHAPNGRMLAIAGLRFDKADTDENKKGSLVVREIREDHTLGPPYLLQSFDGADARLNLFTDAGDDGFVTACRQLLDDHVFLEQQDRGRLLGPRRMKWHEPANWPDGVVPGDSAKWVSGKAFSFYRRPDGALIGVSKMGWTTISRDNGETWNRWIVPSTLVTGKAKVWSQQTADGRFALVYNPSRRNRFPLIAVNGDDGVHFRNMRIIQGELPIQRYAGMHRSIGPQYVRGISRWSTDRSRDERVMWLVYSINKEDIWVSRVPLPIEPDETRDVDDNFSTVPSGPIIPGWNTYQPKWAGLEITDGALLLENRDPYDYASATRCFPAGSAMMIRFTLEPLQSASGRLEIDVLSQFGSRRPIRIVLTADGRIESSGMGRPYHLSERMHLKIATSSGRYSLSVNDELLIADVPFTEPAESLQRIVFRSGAYRGIGGLQPVAEGSDRSQSPVAYRISDFQTSTATSTPA
jgi:hypothetical protein